VAVPAKGYAYHVFPRDLKAQWVRLKTDKDCKATAYFHYSGESDRPASNIAVGLAGAEDGAAPHPRVEGEVIPFCSPEGLLHFAARGVAADGKSADLGLYQVNRDIRITPAPAGKTIDPKTAIVKQPPYGSTLPRFSADSPYSKAAAAGWASRTLREVVTERGMLNYEGTIYDVPRVGGIRRARPIATHGKLFSDFCSWRGLFAVAGARPAAAGDGHVFKSDDGKAALWFGQLEDLWQMGKPRGVGGPWQKTKVAAEKPSPEYMMTGFDRKKVELSHDAAAEVAFAIEVDFLAAAKGTWHRLIEIKVPAGKTVTHIFPDGYSAHWVRVATDKPCTATATFVYE
ncbi:MAG: hypothetical protein ABR915_07155, partial [Thermoguttaceae bacterium]